MWSFGSRAARTAASRARRAAWGAVAAITAATVGLAGATLPPAAGAAEVWLDVSKAGGKRIAIAIPPVAAREGPEETTFREVLENDLLTTGHFQLATAGPAQARQAEQERASGAVDHATWTGWGAELLLRVDATRADGKLAVAATLHDLAARAVLLSRRESDAPGEAVRLAHTIADAVVRALTGERSLAFSRIACTLSRAGEPKRVVVMDYDGRNLRAVSPEGVIALAPDWYPDGSRIAYVTYRQGRPEIVAANLTTGQVRSLAYFPGLNAFPDISPDGRQMLLTLSRDGNPEIYRMALDGSELKRLTFTQAVEASPAWSPDQTQLALVSDQGGTPQIYLVGSSGGRLRRVSFSGNYATSPAWSAKGNRIAFTVMVEGTFQLFLLDPSSGAQEQITFDGEHKESPSWAPDGRHLVYSQGRGSAYRLYVLDVPTGERTLLSREKGSFTSPAWSP